MKKKIIWTVIVLAIIGGVVMLRSGRNEKEYVTSAVVRGDISQVISVTGDVVSKEEVNVSSETGGQMEDDFVNVGDEVSEGQQVASLDASILVSQLREAREALRVAEENEKLSRRDWNSLKPEQRAAKIATTNQARQAVATVQQRIGKTNLFSPMNGKVSAVNYEKGEVVPIGGVVVTILRDDLLEIEADVPESDISELELNQEASLEFDAFDIDGEVKARIIQIYPAATIIQDVVYYKVRFEILGDDDRIKPGMSVDIDVLTNEKKNVLSVPNQAIKSMDSKKVVVVLNAEGQEEEKEVVVGMKGDDGMTEIVSGLKEGENVVTFVKEEN
ncbi:MAG: efflux RND transporter periplasmic adaptor subunit [Candidatus Moranbacteria bacterium]|nr:efflux RND transporter periplasmic adaptor subunit [Candidatus Moranbacteria bacterium]